MLAYNDGNKIPQNGMKNMFSFFDSKIPKMAKKWPKMTKKENFECRDEKNQSCRGSLGGHFYIYLDIFKRGESRAKLIQNGSSS